MSLITVCIWECSEIAIVNKPGEERTPYVLSDHLDESPRFRFGVSYDGSLSMGIEQARVLLNSLSCSIEQYDNIESGLEAVSEYSKKPI
jgi:hypothetical protein